MRSYSIFLLLIMGLLSAHTGHAVKGINSDSLALLDHLKKYKLEKLEHLYIITINPGNCQKCRIGMTRVNDKVTREGKYDNVVYLLRGMRESEMDYYIKNELSFISREKNRFILDESFYNAVDPNAISRLVHIYKNTIKESLHINDADGIDILSNRKLTVLDSMLVDESSAPISKAAQLQVVSDNSFYMADRRYNRIAFYENGKQKRSLELNYDHAALYKKFVSDDAQKNSFAKSTREPLKKMGVKEIELGGPILVRGSNVYATCKILFANKDPKTSDTIINNYPFLIITDTSFKKQQYVLIPSQDSLWPMVQNDLITMDDTHFTFTLMDEAEKRSGKYLVEYVYNKKKGTLKYKRTLNIGLPEYFTKKGIVIFGPNDITVVGNKPHYYFNWVMPTVYNEDSLVYSYPDTTYMHFTSKMWQSAPMRFEIMRFAEWDKSTLIFFTAEENKYFVSLMDKASQEILLKEELPKEIKPFPRIYVHNKKVYAFVQRPKASYMYRLAF